MFAIIKKEIQLFFASPIAYLVIGIFLLLNGLFLFLFKSEFNILDNGFANLNSFFYLAPWILLFLIPGVTMRSFSDEKKQGTLELLLTKPITALQIVLGKYGAACLLIFLALLPSLLYVYTVIKLGNPEGNLDIGSTLGSYFGLLFLIAAYTAIGIFSSTITSNQIVAFITAVFLCFFCYLGIQSIADLLSSNFIENLSMQSHYKSMRRGVLDTRDLLYFISVAVFFIWCAVKIISKNKTNKKVLFQTLILIGFLIGLNTLFHNNGMYKRMDLTKDKRYTLNYATLKILDTIQSPVSIDVFLEGDGFPSEFRKLQTETKQILEEFATKNSNIHFQFINPLKNSSNKEKTIQTLSIRGLKPMQLSVQENGKTTQEVIFPWALASHNNLTMEIPLVKNKIGSNQQELVSNSIQQLEYNFADGLRKLVFSKNKKIAILKGNKELPDLEIFDFVKSIKDYYYIAPFTLDSVATNPQKTLEDIKQYDLIIVAKPTEKFTEKEKFVLDQYTMKGGKSIWLMDAVAIDRDSLFNTAGKSYATSRDLNLTDFFFKYGARINPLLVNDLYAAPITLATGQGSQSQFNQLPWFYSPLVTSKNNHPINNNINLVKFDFANPIDTLPRKNSTNTILLKSSILSKTDGTPREVNLVMAQKEPDPKQYTKNEQTLAVLLEGSFTSVYNNRIKPFKVEKFIPESKPTKIIIVADGDLIKNEVGKNGPQELGFDKWTGQLYGNKEFLLNAVNYLLDDNGLINIRSKQITESFLDTKKIANQKTKWQLVNIVVPLVILALIGFLFNYYRKIKYHKI